MAETGVVWLTEADRNFRMLGLRVGKAGCSEGAAGTRETKVGAREQLCSDNWALRRD